MIADAQSLSASAIAGGAKPAGDGTPACPAGFDAAVTSTTADAVRHRWPLAWRIGFRVAFCYFVTYCLCNGNATLWEAIPVYGGYPGYWLSLPFDNLGQYLAQHLVHVQGVGAMLHDTGSGDTAIHWIVCGEMLAVALAGALIWSALDRRTPHYQTLAAWLRFLIRLTLGMGMITYGFAKVFPLQMPTPMLASLNEPMGNSAPMTMLWSLIGMNPYYEMVCGAAEVLAGLLILWRRTALFGALVTAFVTMNVVLFNFFFDVPVKLYATHLLLMALFVVLPDVEPLFRFFWLHQPAAPLGIWVPPARRRGFRIATAVVEIAFVVLAAGQSIYSSASRWQGIRAARSVHLPIFGGWHIDAVTLHGKAMPLVVGLDQQASELYLQTTWTGQIRSTGGDLWRARLKTNGAKHTVFVAAPGFEDRTYAYVMADDNHLLLTPTGEDADKAPAVALTRIPLLPSYPLLERGFHLVNEWPHHR